MSETHVCQEGRRFERTEDDIKEIKNEVKTNSVDIQTLKEGHAETRVYVKQIFERIEDIRDLVKNATNNDHSDKWQKVVLELIKAIGIIGGIIAGIKLIG